jgi:hypothetical protein
MSKSLADLQQTLAVAYNALKLADKVVFSVPGNGDVSVTVAQARDIVKKAVCELETAKKEYVVVPKELLVKHVAEIDEWNANITNVIGHDPDYFWHSLEDLRAISNP